MKREGDTMDRIQLRSVLIKLMLGCLIVAAAVAVVTILIGEFTDTTGKALGTVFAALIHIGIVLGLVSMAAPEAKVLQKSSDAVVNISIGIAVLSFLTSVFGIWDMLQGETLGKLYLTYIVALVAVLHVKTLLDIQLMYKKVTPYVYANYVFVVLVACMILGLVYSPDGSDLISGFYGRALAASAIIDVTLSVVVAVMYRLYLQQHPKEQSKAHPSGAGSVVRVIFVLLFFFLVILPLSRMFFGLL